MLHSIQTIIETHHNPAGLFAVVAALAAFVVAGAIGSVWAVYDLCTFDPRPRPRYLPTRHRRAAPRYWTTHRIAGAAFAGAFLAITLWHFT